MNDFAFWAREASRQHIGRDLPHPSAPGLAAVIAALLVLVHEREEADLAVFEGPVVGFGREPQSYSHWGLHA